MNLITCVETIRHAKKWGTKGRQKISAKSHKYQLNDGIKYKSGLKFSHSIEKQISCNTVG
jgi:hypothetical protein